MTAFAAQRQAFRLAAAELGMASAAWVTVEACADAAGDAAVAELRDALGRDWPVLDAVCAGWLQGARRPRPAPGALQAALAGTQRLVIVGHEALWIDALVAALPAPVAGGAPALRLGLVCEGDPLADWDRVLANQAGRVERLGLADFQAWAGPRSSLLTFVYGQGQGTVFVLPPWLRVSGSDVRLQFRQLLGWSVLGLPLQVYPRWLVSAAADTLTELVEDVA